MDRVTIDLNGNSKVFKIRNDLGQIMFIVSFICEGGGKYMVKVREITDLYIPSDVFRNRIEAKFEPGDTEEQRKKKDAQAKREALELAERLVKDYRIAVSAMKPYVDPREVFDDQIRYHRLPPPRCCSNCVHAVFDDESSQNRKSRPKVFCNCLENLRGMKRVFGIFDTGDGEMQGLVVKNVPVDFDGLCDNYFENQEILGE